MMLVTHVPQHEQINKKYLGISKDDLQIEHTCDVFGKMLLY